MATLEFRNIEKVIFVPDTWTTVTCQEIYDQSMEWLERPENMWVDNFILGAGKADLGGGEFTGITLTLIDDWRLMFEARSGPSWVNCYVTGGNLVAVNIYSNDPIKPSDYVNAQIRQSTSASIINADAATFWDAQRSDYSTAGSFGEGVNVSSIGVDAIDALSLSADGVAEIADGILARKATGGDSGTTTTSVAAMLQAGGTWKVASGDGVTVTFRDVDNNTIFTRTFTRAELNALRASS